MAEIPTLEPAPDEVVEEYAESETSGRPWLRIAGAVLILIVASGAAAWWYFMIWQPSAQEAQEEPALTGPPLYVALDPPFVVNFEAERMVRFLQVTIQVMSRDPATIDLIKSNDPVIRNDLLLLLANQQYSTVATREGKERLRAEALKTVQRVIGSGGGKPERVEAVYFTSFVMQ